MIRLNEKDADFISHQIRDVLTELSSAIELKEKEISELNSKKIDEKDAKSAMLASIFKDKIISVEKDVLAKWYNSRDNLNKSLELLVIGSN